MTDAVDVARRLRALIMEWRHAALVAGQASVELSGEESITSCTEAAQLERCADELEALVREREGRAEEHCCSGCGLRWDGPLSGAELCGDCWRKGQAVILPSAADVLGILKPAAGAGTPPAEQGFLKSLLTGLKVIEAYGGEGVHLRNCNMGEDEPCDCGYIEPVTVVLALIEQVERAGASVPTSPPQEFQPRQRLYACGCRSTRGTEPLPDTCPSHTGFPTRFNSVEGEYVAALAGVPSPQHFESGNCPHCGAWVDFAQENAIAEIEVASPHAPTYCRSCDHTHLVGTPCWFAPSPHAPKEPK